MRNRRIKTGIIIAGVMLVLYSSISAYRALYYSERNRIRAHLAAMPNVEIVGISGDDHLTYFHAKFLKIRLKDYPNSIIGLEAPLLGLLDESDHIFLSDIGPWRLGSLGHTYIDSKDRTTGEPTRVRTECGYGSIDVGSGSVVADQLPFTVRDLDDLIAHYAQLEAFFAGRPEETQDGKAMRREGNVIKCYLPGDCD